MALNILGPAFVTIASNDKLSYFNLFSGGDHFTDQTKPLETVSISNEEALREEVHSTTHVRSGSSASNTWVGYPKQVMGHANTSNTIIVQLVSGQTFWKVLWGVIWRCRPLL